MKEIIKFHFYHENTGEGKQPTPVFLLGKFRGQRRLAGYSPWGPKESDTAESLNMHVGPE